MEDDMVFMATQGFETFLCHIPEDKMSSLDDE